MRDSLFTLWNMPTCRIWILWSCLFAGPWWSVAQKIHHIRLLSKVPCTENASSIWGFTDSKGHEFALLGTTLGLRIYALADPEKPQELGFIPGNASSWREIKTSGSFAYVTNESGGGLLVVDLSSPSDSLPYQYVTQLFDLQGDTILLATAHTLYVDEKGLIYLAGASPAGNGYLVLDPRSNPWHPRVLAYSNEYYCHEVFAFRDTLYAAELFNGVFSMIDLTIPGHPNRITDQPTFGRFTHSVWRENQRAILYTTDEVEAGRIEAWDISNPQQVIKAGQFQIRGSGIIPHNVFHMNERLFVSYYTEGVRILDTRDPYNLIEVGGYDFHEEHSEGFHGCWSVYPFFDSGILIASDIENGMFVLAPDTNKACYLYARVFSKTDSLPIAYANCVLSIDTIRITSQSDLQGIIRTGFASPQKVQVIIQYKGYRDYVQEITLHPDQPVNLDIFLEPLPTHDIEFRLIDRQTNLPLSEASVIVFNQDSLLNFHSDTAGRVFLEDLYESEWNLSAAKWSYQAKYQENFHVDRDQEFVWYLDKAHEDDFLHNLGWFSKGSDPLVNWTLGDFSELSTSFSNFPVKDLPDDTGHRCYYTNNYDQWDTSYHLHGSLSLISPKMDLSLWDRVHLQYNAWAYGGYKSSKMTHLVVNQQPIFLESIYQNLTGKFNEQTNLQLDLAGMDRDSCHFMVDLYNDPDSAFFEIKLMAALDGFRCQGVSVKTDESPVHFNLGSNPVHDWLMLDVEDRGKFRIEHLILLDATGKKINFETNAVEHHIYLDVSHLYPGIYFLGYQGKAYAKAFIKL
mgnify:CR=1 FL=1